MITNRKRMPGTLDPEYSIACAFDALESALQLFYTYPQNEHYRKLVTEKRFAFKDACLSYGSTIPRSSPAKDPASA
jgi:hypothetical protein